MRILLQPALAAAFLLLMPTLCAAQNILDGYNGDFESGLTQWRFFEVPTSLGSTAEVITSGVAHGAKAVKLTFVDPGTSLGDRALDSWDTNVPVQEGTAYTASVQARSDNANLYLHIAFGFFDSQRAVLDEGVKSFLLTGSYQTFSIARTAPATAAYCWIAFRLKDGSGRYAAGTLYLDNASLVGEGVVPVQFVPRIVSLTLPSDDVPVASLDVTEQPFGAKADGSADATNAVQQAIDYAAGAGGGVIFIPAGRYRFDGALLLREKTMLRGDWQSPDEGGTGKGTILMVYGGQGNEAGTPFLTMNRGSGIRDLSIWYPQQTITPTAYPWTILCNPDNSEGRGNNVSIIDITLINPYQGIKIGPGWNELHYVRNVYGTPLKTGLWLSQTTDIGRLMNVHFEPRFWAASGLAGAPAESAIKTWLQNNAEGIDMGRSDWEYIYDVSLVGYKVGMRIFRYDNSGPAANGVAYGLRVQEGQIGVLIDILNPYGYSFTGSRIDASAGSSPACVQAAGTFTTVAQFNSCVFGGAPATAIRFDDNATGRLTFQHCVFEQWGYQGGTSAISVPRGSLAVLGSTFALDRTQVELGPGVTSAQILDNRFAGQRRIASSSTGDVVVSQEPLALDTLAAPPHPFAAEPRPSGNNLYVVTEYGAVGNTTTDNTAAFQAALNAAGSAGGGTVYVPAGWFRISGHISVPAGVELRGIWDVPHHTTSQGSVLLAYEGKGNAGGTPFITLAPGSGVRGFTVWYPEQALTAFPWTVQATGAGCWLKDVTLANSYLGVDMATYPSANHYVSYLGGSPLKVGLTVGNNSGDGWVENVQFNPHYWLRSGGYPRTSTPSQDALVAYQQATLDAISVGGCSREHILGTFVFAAYRGLYFRNDGGPCNADVYLHGTDAGSYGVSLESPAGSTLNFVNTQLVVFGAAAQSYIHSGPLFAGTASFYNTMNWGDQTRASADINGTGRVVVQQLNTLGEKVFVRGGTSSLQNITMVRSFSPQVDLSASLVRCSIIGGYNPAGFSMDNRAGDRVEADYNFGDRSTEVRLRTGWESAHRQNDWNNTLYNCSEAGPPEGEAFLPCASLSLDSGIVLAVRGKDLDGTASSVRWKILKTRMPVFGSTVLTYRRLPKNDLGRSVHLDLLFTDGSRLTEYNARAQDSLPLSSSRGAVDVWDTVRCAVGRYAPGKTIQTVLVGYDRVGAAGDFESYIDDLSIGASVDLPPPWQGYNIGTPDPGGLAVPDGNSFFLQAAGGGVQYAGDSFFLLGQPYTGDVALTARLDRFDQGVGNAFAGLMIRDSLGPTSRFMQIALSQQFGIQSYYRLQSNSAIVVVTHTSVGRTLPVWLKLIRTGNLFSSYSSPDSVTWNGPLCQQAVSMDSFVVVGMGISSFAPAANVFAGFSEPRVSPEDPLDVDDRIMDVPSSTVLMQNFPNPFNPTTVIRYGIPGAGHVSLSIYNVLGQEVRTFVEGVQPAGFHTVTWDSTNESGAGVSSGMYLYCLRAGGKQLLGKMLLVR